MGFEPRISSRNHQGFTETRAPDTSDDARCRLAGANSCYEFQAAFHWRVADLGMEHVYRTENEVRQLLTCRDEADLEKKLAI